MAEAPPVDLSTYEFDPCWPLPTGRAARDHVIKKEPCQPTDVDYPKDRFNRKFLSSWYGNFDWLEYIQSHLIKRFVSTAEFSTDRYITHYRIYRVNTSGDIYI